VYVPKGYIYAVIGCCTVVETLNHGDVRTIDAPRYLKPPLSRIVLCLKSFDDGQAVAVSKRRDKSTEFVEHCPVQRLADNPNCPRGGSPINHPVIHRQHDIKPFRPARSAHG